MKRKIHREDIIKSGFDLFYEKGFGVTGIKEITERIDIPKGSFYNHFESKEAFGLEVLQHYNTGSLKLIKKTLFSKNDSPINNLKRFFEGVIKNEEYLQCTKGCLMGNFTMELSDVNESFQNVVKNNFSEITQLITQCLENAQKQGEINKEIDTKEMAFFILNSWHGALLRMKADKTTHALKAFMKTVFETLLQ